MRVLLLCDSFRMAYRVVRTAGHACREVHVLASVRARGLKYSRYCASFRSARDRFDVEAPEGAVEAINECISLVGVDLVMPADPNTSRFLISARDRLTVPIFPAPDLETFDRLNDKAEFTRIMRDLGERCPPSRQLENGEALAQAWKRGEIVVASIAKPLSQSGGRGVRKLAGPGAAAAIAAIDYGPVLVQDLIEGLDVSVAIYCSSGSVMASVAYTRRDGMFEFLSVDPISRPLAALAASLGLTGIFGFDLIVSPNGQEIHWLECNPRVFFSIDACAFVGVNLVACGLQDLGYVMAAPPMLARARGNRPRRAPRIRRLKGMCRDLIRPWAIKRDDWRFLMSRIADPMAFAIDGLTRR